MKAFSLKYSFCINFVLDICICSNQGSLLSLLLIRLCGCLYLDNRSITADLVNYLRNKKLERQIIAVTHNANIVVNADAENVIVANQKGQNDDKTPSSFKFDYINGSIENSFDKLPEETDLLKSMGIRQHIADIVEGGKDAFIMREKKYRFH